MRFGEGTLKRTVVLCAVPLTFSEGEAKTETDGESESNSNICVQIPGSPRTLSTHGQDPYTL